jgi:putative transposase
MISTFKIKHDKDFTSERDKGRKVAEYALSYKTRSSKDVKQFGLKSAIASQIRRKYGKNKFIKSVRNIKLTVQSQSIKFNTAYIEKHEKKISIFSISISESEIDINTIISFIMKIQCFLNAIFFNAYKII